VIVWLKFAEYLFDNNNKKHATVTLVNMTNAVS